MIKRVDYKKLIFLLALLVLSITVVTAHLGIRPAIIEVDYEPGKEFIIDYSVDTTPETKVNISAEGDMLEAVKFDRTKMSGAGTFKAIVKLPQEAQKVGTNRLYIFAKQEVDPSKGFGTAISVGALIKIYVPYPGKYLETTLAIENVNKGQEGEAKLEIINRGKEHAYINPTLEIYSGDELIEKTNFLEGAEILAPTQTKEVTKKIQTKDYTPGDYRIVAVTEYGGEKPAIAERNWRIGTLNIQVINYTKKMISGKISQFTIEIQNDWKDSIEGVYANVTLARAEKKADGISFLTPPVTVSGFGNYELSGFADLSNTKAGDYETNITLHFSGKTSSIKGLIKVENEKSNLLLIIIVAAIIILVGTVVLIYKKRRKKQAKKKEK